MESLMDTLRTTYKLTGLPVYQSKYCVNTSSLGYDCDACVRLCPEGIFAEGKKTKKTDFSKCTKCGICVAVCPAKAISPVDTEVRSFVRALAKDNEISAGCIREEAGWSVSYDCLAALSWEQIACAALKNGIVISMRTCADCEERACASQIIENLTKAKNFLGDDLFFDKVRILEKNDVYEASGNAISRRELFTFFKRIPLDSAGELLPEKNPTDRTELFYRALLRDLVQQKYAETQKEERTRYRITLPRIQDSCNGCGICARMCQEKALAIQIGADGTRLVTIEPWKCTACRKCTKTCTRKAIDGMGQMQVTHLGAVLMKRVKKETTV